MAASCNHVGVIRSRGRCRYGKALVMEKRIPCGGCREEDSPITIWKEGFKRKGRREGGMKQSEGGGRRAVQFEVRTERTDRRIVPFATERLAVTSG